MKINVYGLGYVGSVSAACLVESGHDVLGIDIDSTKVDSINSGVSSVVEPGLTELIGRGAASGRLRATTDDIQEADVSLVCVGTPSQENGSLSLEYVKRATTQIGEALRAAARYHVVCIRSTVLPGTVEQIVLPILESASGRKAGSDFGLCMNPEFLREGTSIRDYYNPSFTIIGELDARSGDVIEQLYAKVPGDKVRLPIAVAEMVKYTGNAFHALKITFANEIGNLCKRMGLDGRQVMDVFCRDVKLNVSAAYLQPGFAFGGSCLPKDIRALLHKAKDLDMEPPVLRAILVSNDAQVEEAYRLIKKTGRKKIGVLGLSFKPGTDDLRESPTAELVEILLGKGYQVSIYDREVSLARVRGSNKTYIDRTIPHISCLLKTSIESVVDESDVVVVAKRAPEFAAVLDSLNNGHSVIDLASMWQNGKNRPGKYEGICW